MISAVKDLEDVSSKFEKIIILQPSCKNWFRQRSMDTKSGGHFNEKWVID